MKSDSELMNELAHKTNYLHEMTSSESSAMKRALLDIYRDVAKLCENTTVQRNYPIGSVDLNRNHSSDVLV